LAILQEEKKEHNMRKNFYLLIGPPAVGKSTWIKKTYGDNLPYVISRDNFVDQVAAEIGVTYNEMFSSKEPFVKEANKKVDRLVEEKIDLAKYCNKDIVVDMTNLTLGRRNKNSKAISGVEDKYKKIAVLFNFLDNEEIIFSTAQKRAKIIKESGNTKDISKFILTSMIKSYQEITPEENFEEIINIDTTQDLKKFIGE
jgi:hypothetical protein